MKIMITVSEAMDKGIWPLIADMFGREAEDDIWPNEQFILTEEQAKELKLI